MIKLGEAVEKLQEENCPTDPSKWSYYTSQAKDKFEIYPSAYANAWASQKYGDAGGGWKKCPKKESVNEAQKVNPTSKKFLKGMKKIKVKGLGGYMPGVDYVYVDGDKYYFVDFEGDHMELKNTNTIKQLHKLHGKSLGESVNEGPIDRIVGGRPYKYVGDGRKGKVIVSGPMTDNQKADILKRAKKAGYTANPNMGGGVTIVVESVNEASVGDFEIGDFVHFKSKNKTGMVVSVKGNKVTINTPKGKITSDVKDVKVLHQDNVNTSVKEDENDPQEIKVGNYQTKYFHVCPGASTLYKDIESKGVDMDMAERSVRLQDALFFIEEHIQKDGYKPETDYVMVAKNIAKNIMKLAKMMGLEEEHNYIQGHIDTIEKVISGGSVNEGNAFTGALFKARKEGLTEFEFNGKKYPVHKLEEEEVIEEGLKLRHKMVREGVMSNIDMLAGESDTFMDFMKTFKKEYPEFDYKNRDLVKWLQSTYKSKRG
jgi:hypothetical protein